MKSHFTHQCAFVCLGIVAHLAVPDLPVFQYSRRTIRIGLRDLYQETRFDKIVPNASSRHFALSFAVSIRVVIRKSTRLSIAYKIVAATIVIAICTVDVAAQDPGRFGRWLYEDARAFVYQVGPRIPLFAVGGAALLLPTSTFDQSGLDRIQGGYHGTWGDYLDVSNEFGGPLVIIPLAGIFEASLIFGDERFQDAAFTSLQSWIFSGMLSKLFKFAFGRYRPGTGSSPDHIVLFSGHTSFPSGHTSGIFSVVTPWVLYYPNVATYGLFLLGASTAIARIALDKHWPTDVIAGATLGILTGRWLAKRHKDEGSSPGSKITPIVGPESAGIRFTYRFR